MLHRHTIEKFIALCHTDKKIHAYNADPSYQGWAAINHCPLNLFTKSSQSKIRLWTEKFRLSRGSSLQHFTSVFKKFKFYIFLKSNLKEFFNSIL